MNNHQEQEEIMRVTREEAVRWQQRLLTPQALKILLSGEVELLEYLSAEGSDKNDIEYKSSRRLHNFLSVNDELTAAVEHIDSHEGSDGVVVLSEFASAYIMDLTVKLEDAMTQKNMESDRTTE